MNRDKAQMNDIYARCTLCERACNVDRYHGQKGYCGMNAKLSLARADLHMWEEPCISGINGSGAIFFSGCNLLCVYCQNKEIACGQIGQEISEERLIEIFFELKEKGAHNINLVTGSHYVPTIAYCIKEAKRQGFSLPFVFNCGGYESVDALKMLDGLIDIYLTDFKYMDEKLAKRYSKTKDYPEVAKRCLREMVSQCGEVVFDEEGMMKRGVIVRNLLLPGGLQNSMDVVKYVYDTYKDNVYLSLMNQYTPLVKYLDGYEELKDRVSNDMYETLIDYAVSIGVENGFIQEGETAEESFIPSFDYEGVYA